MVKNVVSVLIIAKCRPSSNNSQNAAAVLVLTEDGDADEEASGDAHRNDRIHRRDHEHHDDCKGKPVFKKMRKHHGDGFRVDSANDSDPVAANIKIAL